MISLDSALKEKTTFKGDFISNHWTVTKTPSGQWSCISPANLDWKFNDIQFHYPHVDAAVESGQQAFAKWKAIPLQGRLEIIKRFGEELEKRKDKIARHIAVETGKPFDEALGEAGLLKAKINVTIDEGLKLISEQKLDLGAGLGRGEIHWRPKGLLVVIGPFNFPVHLSNGHIIPALITGNTIILKPSEKTPYCAQIYMEAAEAAEFPPGVIQLVHGNADLATRLIRHPHIDGVLATCSYDVGAKIQKELAAEPEKIIALEMGGKNAALIWEFQDLQKCADDLIRSSFLTTGQRCTALSRCYVKREFIDALTESFHKKAKDLVIGHPFQEDPKPFMGPIISARSREDFLRYSHIAESEGAEIVMRGKPLEGTPQKGRHPLPEGYYVTPSIHAIKKWDPKSNYQTHEIFGPDIFFCPIDSIEEGIAAVNSTDYGLSFSFYGGNEATFEKVADSIEAGLCYWNRPTVGASAKLPFGGWKRSGNQRPAGIFAIYNSVQSQARIK